MVQRVTLAEGLTAFCPEYVHIISPRLQENSRLGYVLQNIESNKAIVGGIKAIAAGKGVTAAELCIAWVCALGSHVIPIPGSSYAFRHFLDSRTSEADNLISNRHFSRTMENTHAASIDLTPEEIEAVNKILANNPVQGSRYGPGTDEQNHLWG